MYPEALAQKVWEKANGDGNKLVLENCTENEVLSIIKAQNCKSVATGYAKVQQAVIQYLNFKEVQQRKNGALN